MFDFMKFLGKEKSSKNVAKDRLKFVLVHDRANCSPEFLEKLKLNLLETISEYMEIDEENLQVNISQTTTDDGQPALVANIPIKNMKR